MQYSGRKSLSWYNIKFWVLLVITERKQYNETLPMEQYDKGGGWRYWNSKLKIQATPLAPVGFEVFKFLEPDPS